MQISNMLINYQVGECQKNETSDSFNRLEIPVKWWNLIRINEKDIILDYKKYGIVGLSLWSHLSLFSSNILVIINYLQFSREERGHLTYKLQWSVKYISEGMHSGLLCP